MERLQNLREDETGGKRARGGGTTRGSLTRQPTSFMMRIDENEKTAAVSVRMPVCYFL